MISKIRFTYCNLLFTCWYLMLACIGFEYWSKPFFILEIVLIVGIRTFFKVNKYNILKKDIINILGMSVIMLGVCMSRLFYTPQLSMFLNISFVVKMFLFFVFCYFFITRYGIPYKSLVVIALFSLPHFIAFNLGFGSYVNGQFGGFRDDPNYMGPDLLSAFSASLVLINNRNLGPLKLLFYITFLVSAFLLMLSVSRTATSAALLILVFYFIKLAISSNNNFWLKFFVISTICLLVFVFMNPDFSENLYYQRLYDRFFNSSKGGGLLENERYIVWGISFDLIQETGLFKGYGVEEFLVKQYHFLSHNAWLDIGVRMGSYTFWTHAGLSIFGLIIWGLKYLRNIFKIPTWGTHTFAFIFCLSVSFMMFSISVSQMYYYWFVLFLIYIFGFSPWTNKNLLSKNGKRKINFT